MRMREYYSRVLRGGRSGVPIYREALEDYRQLDPHLRPLRR